MPPLADERFRSLPNTMQAVSAQKDETAVERRLHMTYVGHGLKLAEGHAFLRLADTGHETWPLTAIAVGFNSCADASDWLPSCELGNEKLPRS